MRDAVQARVVHRERGVGGARRRRAAAAAGRHRGRRGRRGLAARARRPAGARLRASLHLVWY